MGGGRRKKKKKLNERVSERLKRKEKEKVHVSDVGKKGRGSTRVGLFYLPRDFYRVNAETKGLSCRRRCRCCLLLLSVEST